MSIGILALVIAIILLPVCVLSRPPEPARQRIDCRPVCKIETVDMPTEL